MPPTCSTKPGTSRSPTRETQDAVGGGASLAEAVAAGYGLTKSATYPAMERWLR